MLTDTWNYPRQQGVILTPCGTIAPGIIIGAIAASLQHQNIAVNQLVTNLEAPSNTAHNYDSPNKILFNNTFHLLKMNSTNIYNLKYNKEEVEFILPRSQIIHKPSMWYNALKSSSMKIDNIWLTTIAGKIYYCTNNCKFIRFNVQII